MVQPVSIQGTHYHPHHDPHGKGLLKLALGALGVVYGDIGTSPLYSLKESFTPAHGLALNHDNVYGILSLVFWALTLVVSFKYLRYILRADKQGEGGITTLLALLLPNYDNPQKPQLKKFRNLVIILGVFGAGLLYGDGMITPAISVLSAIEGLQVATPAFQPIIIPLTVIILFLLFFFQKYGTSKIGAVFGPTMFIWFLTLALTGIPWIIRHPEILTSINPLYAFHFFATNGANGFLVLGSVVLCITGGEALYADMGHFGKRPIRLGWYSIVFPALLINYMGQGAVVLEKGASAIENPFYALVDGWWIYPLVLVATTATVIASQALISGAFSLTLQSVQLGFFPRTAVHYTSRDMEGQIYVPRVNAFLMISCIALVIIFQNSTHLAAAYGIAVTGTMTITSLLFFLVARQIWNWKLPYALLITSLFLIVDLSFLGANIIKIFHGGWVPILVAFFFLALMTTWKQGRTVLAQRMKSTAVPLDEFFHKIQNEGTKRVPGTAIFMTLTKDIAPSVLLHHYKHNQTLHEQVILLSVITEHEPEVKSTERVRTTDLELGFVKVIARYGYMESPDIQEILSLSESAGLRINHHRISYFLGRETFVTTGKSGMAHWRKRLFIIMSRNARSAAEYFNLPADDVIEIGSQIKI